MEQATAKSAVVLAVEPGCHVGSALARCFAGAGMHVFMAAAEADTLHAVAADIRQSGGNATAMAADVTSETAVAQLVQAAGAAGPLAIAAYTTSAKVPADLLDAPAELLEQLWRRNVYGAFLLGREAAKQMLPARQGTVLFAGASAEPPARPPYSPFAIAKSGLRTLVQGMAKEFGPLGLHVLDAVLEGTDHGATLPNGIDPLILAERCWAAHCEPAHAWSYEIRF
jgi:NAD(P)-dependent dehydrogenase (short-subunit alcohol dehydrogenase family)